MVKRVTAPAEHYLITNADLVKSQLANEALKAFSIQKLIDVRLTNKNMRSGLDFSDNHKARRSRSKLIDLLITFLNKEIPYIKEGVNISRPFVSKPVGTDQFKIVTFYDVSVIRYVNRIQRFLFEKRIPISTTVVPDKDADRIDMYFAPGGTSRLGTLHYYKLLCFLPETIKFFKVLSKKAQFTDENVKTHNRYKPPASLLARNSGHNARNSPRVSTTSRRT